jgi:hypothetical protein
MDAGVGTREGASRSGDRPEQLIRDGRNVREGEEAVRGTSRIDGRLFLMSLAFAFVCRATGKASIPSSDFPGAAPSTRSDNWRRSFAPPSSRLSAGCLDAMPVT